MLPATKGPERRGLTLIEAALVLGIAAIVFGGLAEALSVAAENNRSKIAADRLNEVATGAQRYLQTYSAQLLKALPVNGPGVVVPVGRPCPTCVVPGGPATIPTLPGVQSGGFLPSNFVDATSYGQFHVFVARAISSPSGMAHVEGMVFTEGPAVPDRQLGRLARFMGAEGGFMLNDTSNSPYGAGNVVGVAGGWSANPSDWAAGGYGPTPGHVMALLTANNSALTGDYLNRNNTGDPEANTMRTDLHLGNNNIDQVQNITSNDPNNGTIQIGPNISVSGYIKAGGDISSATSVTAPRFIDSDDPRFYVDPNGTSNLQNVDAQNVAAQGGTFGCPPGTTAKVGADQETTVLTVCGPSLLYGPTVVGNPADKGFDGSDLALQVQGALFPQYLDVDTYVFGSSRGLPSGDSSPGAGRANPPIRLGDLLPNYVAKGQFFWQIYSAGGAGSATANVVPKPLCPTGATPSVQVSLLSDNMQLPRIRVNTEDTGSVLGYYLGGPTGYPLTSLNPIVTSIDTTQEIFRKVEAVDAGDGTWTVAYKGTLPATNASGQASGAGAQQLPITGLANTFCSFGTSNPDQ